MCIRFVFFSIELTDTSFKPAFWNVDFGRPVAISYSGVSSRLWRTIINGFDAIVSDNLNTFMAYGGGDVPEDKI